MNEDIKFYLENTDKKHSDFVDAYAYMIAGKMAKLRDDYFFIYIKKKPKWCPVFVYKWFIKKFVVIAEFRK